MLAHGWIAAAAQTGVLLAAGTPLPVIQAHLGHESITTAVDRYGHFDRRTGERAAEAIAGSLTHEAESR